ncbi:MAG: hypothetical protein Q8W51_01790 [Candidatus Palauibacterales bacterium]|nr:hypothetical protein [Candidatus Palauibacterales bacterium]MDP2528453.1 hypothetical protein [Candidatus Palauibacterales bacterium]MDP2584458.1 hypothetical protein [Candidatus Palauibacterales bacterium]
MLNDHQRRRLTVRMGRLVEEAEPLLDLLRESPDGASQALRDELETLIRTTRAAAARLEIDLEGPSPDLSHRVRAWSAAWWTRILDCRPEHLKGLGEVDPIDADRIAPEIDEIAGHLARLQRLAGE